MQAGHRLAWNNLLRICEDHTVDLFLISNKKEQINLDLYELNNIGNIYHCPISFFNKIYFYFLNLSKISPKFATRNSRKAKNHLIALLTSVTYKIIWVEFTEPLVLLDGLSIKSHIILSVHDILTQWSLRKKGLLSIFTNITYRNEERLLSLVDEIRVLSPKDKHLLESLYGLHGVLVNPPELSDFTKNFNRNSIQLEPYSIIFWGAMSRPENSKAIEFFIDNHWSEILEAYPLAKIYIVGSGPSDSLMNRTSDSIVVTGFVEDPTIYFQKSSLGIAPLMDGAGVKLKVLEMLHTGLPVLSTKIGAEGIEHSELLQIIDINQFSKYIIDFFSHVRADIKNPL